MFNPKKSMMVLALTFAVALMAWAVPVTVDFVDGTVQVQASSGWVALDFGDVFDSSRTIRLAARSIVELSAQNGTKVVLSTAGNYIVDSLLQARPVSNVITNLTDKLEQMANQATGSQESTVAGVRASAAVEEEGQIWAGPAQDAQHAMNEGLLAMDAEDPASAWDHFNLAQEYFIEAGDPIGQASAAYHAAQAGLAMGSPARALFALRSGDPENAGEFRATYTLMLATLNARYGDPAAAKALLTRALAAAWFSNADQATDARALLTTLP